MKNLFLPYWKRRMRQDLIYFIEAVWLYLSVGYELRYGWTEAHKAVPFDLCPRLKELLLGDPSEGMGKHLQELGVTFPLKEARVWFVVLRESYLAGASLGELLSSMNTFLRQEQERILLQHGRRLPAKLNLILILFFLPSTFLLLFTPLLLEITTGF